MWAKVMTAAAGETATVECKADGQRRRAARREAAGVPRPMPSPDDKGPCI